MEFDWQNSKPSLVQAVSHIFETGLFSDLTFRVGLQLHQFNAHKVVVMSRSKVFAAMLESLQDRWDTADNSEDDNRSIIDIPYFDPKSFQCFLKYLYTDDLEDPASVEVSLEVLRMAYFYRVQALVLKSCELLTSKINLQNCVQIYMATRLDLDNKIKLPQSAFAFITRNIKDVLGSPSFMGLDKDVLIRLLQCDDIEVDETELFKGVLKWSEHEESAGIQGRVPTTENNLNISKNSETRRKAELELLIPLIRFPLMGSKTFAKEVVPLKVLSNQTVIDMFVHFNGVPVDDLKFSTKPRHQFK